MNLERISSSRIFFAVSIFLSVIIPLLTGALIYMLSRERSIYFLRILPLHFEKISLPDWVKFNLPDGLWAFSFSSLISIVWKNSSEKNYYLWLIIISILSLLLEILYGTFDSKDILFVLAGLLIPVLIRNKNIYIPKK
jgi:hypothetical protein